MPIINPVKATLHRIRVKLYPGYLPHTRGKYIARTDDEAALSVKQICASATDRGGFPAKREVMEEYVNMYHAEAAYQLADGFAINTGWYTIHSKIGGTFAQAEGADPRDHKIEFTFRALAPLRALAAKIELVIEGVADVQGYIGECVDVSSGLVNETLTPGGMIVLRGHKIKIEGDDPAVGLYLVNQTSGARVPAAGPPAENSASQVITLIPTALPAGTYRLEIVTHYTRGGSNLKEPRTISYPVDLTTG